MGCFRLQERPKSAQERFQLVFFRLQERSKSAPRRLLRRRCDWEPVLDPFFAPKSEPGTSKIKQILCTVVKNQGFAIFSPSRLRTSIWDPFGFFFGTHLAPKIVETSLQGPLGPAKSRFRLVLFGPEGFQERSKRPPRDLQAAKTAPRGLQEAPGSILEPFWNHFGVDFRIVLKALEADDYTDVGR